MMLKKELKEIKNHGTPQFPLEIYDVQFHTANTLILPLHWHEEFEMLYLSEGAATFVINQESYHLHEGQLLLINGGDIHSGYASDAQGCRYHSIVFDLSILSNSHNHFSSNDYISLLRFGKLKIPACIRGETPEEKNLLSMILRIISKEKEHPVIYELFIRGFISIFFSTLFEDNIPLHDLPQKPYSNIKLENIKKSISFIENNYNKKLTINDMAANVNMSRHYFCKFFKDYTTFTPFEYLNIYRINRAAELLATQNYTVTEVAYEVGYDNLSYFIKQFKRHKNITPGRWR